MDAVLYLTEREYEIVMEATRRIGSYCENIAESLPYVFTPTRIRNVSGVVLAVYSWDRPLRHHVLELILQQIVKEAGCDDVVVDKFGVSFGGERFWIPFRWRGNAEQLVKVVFLNNVELVPISEPSKLVARVKDVKGDDEGLLAVKALAKNNLLKNAVSFLNRV